jgi:hypothetical protein
LCPKWQQLFTGPFTIIRVIDKYNYMIAKSATAKPLIVHRDKLKIYCSNFVAADSGPAIGNDVVPLSQSANDQPVSQTTTAINDNFSQQVPSQRQQTIDSGDDLNATQPYIVPQSTTDMQVTRPKRTIRKPARFADNVYVLNSMQTTHHAAVARPLLASTFNFMPYTAVNKFRNSTPGVQLHNFDLETSKFDPPSADTCQRAVHQRATTAGVSLPVDDARCFSPFATLSADLRADRFPASCVNRWRWRTGSINVLQPRLYNYMQQFRAFVS